MFFKFVFKFLILIIAVFVFINTANAQLLSGDVVDEIAFQEMELADEAGFAANASVGGTMTVVIKAFLSVLGILFIVLILMGGFNWMTAQGEEEKVRKAQNTIKRAIVGLIIMVAAYAITNFVFENLNDIETGGGPGGPTGFSN